MKKYAQIFAVALIFGGLIVFRRLHRDEKGPESSLVLPTPTSISNASPLPVATPLSSPSTSASKYRDGSYTGTTADAQYGNLQVQAVIKNGRLADVTFLQYPNDNRTSSSINTQAIPLLTSEAIHAQSSQVDIISGASSSSEAFRQSLGAALQQAQLQ